MQKRFEFSIHHDDSTTLTTHDIVYLCKDLCSTFGPGYDFAPLRIHEGGVEMIKWPLKEEQRTESQHLKDLRFYGREIEQYPHIPLKEDACDYLLKKEPIHLFSITPEKPLFVRCKGSVCSVPWTKEEIKSVKETFLRRGVDSVGPTEEC